MKIVTFGFPCGTFAYKEECCNHIYCIYELVEQPYEVKTKKHKQGVYTTDNKLLAETILFFKD